MHKQKYTPFMRAKEFRKSKIRGSAQRLFLYLATNRCHHKTNSCMISQATIAADTGMDPKTIRKASLELINSDWLRRTKVSTNKGQWVYRYTIYDPNVDSDIPPVDGENSPIHEGNIPHTYREKTLTNRIGSLKEPINELTNIAEDSTVGSDTDNPWIPTDDDEDTVGEWGKFDDEDLDDTSAPLPSRSNSGLVDSWDTSGQQIDEFGESHEDDQPLEEYYGTEDDRVEGSLSEPDTSRSGEDDEPDQSYIDRARNDDLPAEDDADVENPGDEGSGRAESSGSFLQGFLLEDIARRAVNDEEITCEEYKALISHSHYYANVVSRPPGCTD